MRAAITPANRAAAHRANLATIMIHPKFGSCPEPESVKTQH